MVNNKISITDLSSLACIRLTKPERRNKIIDLFHMSFFFFHRKIPPYISLFFLFYFYFTGRPPPCSVLCFSRGFKGSGDSRVQECKESKETTPYIRMLKP